MRNPLRERARETRVEVEEATRERKEGIWTVEKRPDELLAVQVLQLRLALYEIGAAVIDAVREPR